MMFTGEPQEVGADGFDWKSMSSAPRDGTAIYALNEDGLDLIEYRADRQCMLGPRAGEMGEGWVSKWADHLPIDEPLYWDYAPCDQGRRL